MCVKSASEKNTFEERTSARQPRRGIEIDFSVFEFMTLSKAPFLMLIYFFCFESKTGVGNFISGSNNFE